MKFKLLLFVLMVFLTDTCIYGLDKESTPPPVTDELIVYEPGNMPIIILAPHDGQIKPDGLPLMTNGTRDVNASKLAREIISQLTYTDANQVEHKPYLVIDLASRAVVDLNQSWEDNLQEGWFDTNDNPVAPPTRTQNIYNDFHACADHAIQQVQSEYGSGILIDLHGMGSSRKVDMYGYRVHASSLRSENGDAPSTDAVLATAIRGMSSIQYAASRKENDLEVANLLRGQKSLASLVDQAYKILYPNLEDSEGNVRGRPATPSFRFPNPKSSDSPSHDKVYFNGGYDIRAHSSYQEGISVDAVQIETTVDARNNETLRIRFARCMTAALREFMPLHYDLNITEGAPHTADSNADWSISQDEVNSFITAYNNNNNSVAGDLGSITSNRITMREVMRVIYLYNNGGSYISGQSTVDGYDVVLPGAHSVPPHTQSITQATVYEKDKSLIVISTSDSGAGSLRNAIAIAADGETLTIDASIGNITVLSEIIIDKSITIDGQGAAIISGENQTRIFRIKNDDRQIDVTLKNVGIVDAANAIDEFGGAIYNNGQALTLDTVLLDGNKNTTENGKGGAVYSSGTLNVNNCEFRNNKASEDNDIH